MQMIDNRAQLERTARAFLLEGRVDACINVHQSANQALFAQVVFSPPESDVFCPKCRTRQYLDAAYCHRCGTALPAPPQDHGPFGLIINFAFPHSTDPVALLNSLGVPLPADSTLVDWQPGLSATISTPPLEAHAIAELLSQILGRVQPANPSKPLQVSLDYGY